MAGNAKSSAQKSTSRGNQTLYFLALIVLFGCLSLGLNLRFESLEQGGFDHQKLRSILMDSFSNGMVNTANAEAQDDSTDKIPPPLQQEDTGHKLAGLNCDAHGGPSMDIAAEMVYWEDIPSDAAHISPFKRTSGPKQYLTFEPDEGGW
jgi:hypothetical protein